MDCFPENILIEILSYLSIRELLRSARVCKRWRQLVKDQRLWRNVDLSTWKGMTSRVLWVLLRQYLGRGLRYLRLRGLLLSARAGAFLSEPWLQTLSSKCPRLCRLTLLHTDLRGLRSCSLLPHTLQVLELRSCEVPPGFFTQNPPGSPELDGPKPAASKIHSKPPKSPSFSGISIETLVLDNVPSFTNQHLQSLSSWARLSRLELRELIRVTAAGLRACAPPGPQALARLRHLEMDTGNRQQMAALGLGEGWAGLEGLGLGGREVSPGLLCLSRLPDLRWLRLRNCRLTEMMVLRSCRTLKELHRLEFWQVEFVTEGRGGGEAEGGGEKEEGEREREEPSENDPVPNLRRSLGTLLPKCSLLFTQCKVTENTD
ncbi:F-box/LRR-repeat protein 12 [Astyanax mexicanus]|uniref:F-box/LRR-repeat protein 12 n=1 Tax=Astyanax mexicanus TaxID=7994 RepID=UPI0020CACF63|nr:F-box/LRR-repeat protein 12 [Astyanax mexicanus]